MRPLGRFLRAAPNTPVERGPVTCRNNAPSLFPTRIRTLRSTNVAIPDRARSRYDAGHYENPTAPLLWSQSEFARPSPARHAGRMRRAFRRTCIRSRTFWISTPCLLGMCAVPDRTRSFVHGGCRSRAVAISCWPSGMIGVGVGIVGRSLWSLDRSDRARFDRFAISGRQAARTSAT